jgi:hypothetical protein
LIRRASPATFAEFEKTVLALNTPPDRYAFGFMGRQGPGSYLSFGHIGDGRPRFIRTCHKGIDFKFAPDSPVDQHGQHRFMVERDAPAWMGSWVLPG